MGAFFIASMSMFTSCKDYDDDINDLQAQIDKKAALDKVDDLISRVTDAETQAKSAYDLAASKASKEDVEAVKTTATEAAKKAAQEIAEAASTKADEAAQAAQAAQKTADEALATAGDVAGKLKDYVLASELKTQLEDLKAELENGSIKKLEDKVKGYDNAINALYSAVTEVSLVGSFNADKFLSTSTWDGTLNVETGLVTKNLVFGKKELDDKKGEHSASTVVEYKKNTQFGFSGKILVRVNPVNAVVTKDMIKLIDSKGNDLEGVLEVADVEKYDELLTTRASGNKTGLWLISFQPKKDKDGIDETVKTTVSDSEKNKLYAVAINNTASVAKDVEAAAERYVVSSYDLQIAAKKWVNSNKTLHEVKVYSENTLGKDNAITLKDAKARDDAQNHEGSTVVPAQSGENVVVDFSNLINQAEYFYVVRDDKHAGESDASEINAWNAYEYAGLNTIYPASQDGKVTVTIPASAKAGDEICFRVFAVNYDGSYVLKGDDPSDGTGHSFSVYVTSKNTTASVVGEIKATGANTAETAWLPITGKISDAGQAFTQDQEFKLKVSDNETWTVKAEFAKDAKGEQKTVKSSEIKYVKFTSTEVMTSWTDGATASLAYQIKETAHNTVTDVFNISLTKVLPTAEDAKKLIGYSWKDKQLVNGVYTAYLYPEKSTDWNIDTGDNGENAVKNGYKDLNQAINKLAKDPKAYLEIANAAQCTTNEHGNNKHYYDKPLYVYGNDKEDANNWKMTVSNEKDDAGTALIDNKTEHKAVFGYNFGQISSVKVNGAYADYKVNVDEDAFKIVFACPLNNTVQTFKFNNYVIPATATSPEEQIAVNQIYYNDVTGSANSAKLPEGHKSISRYLVATNTFDNSVFGGSWYGYDWQAGYACQKYDLKNSKVELLSNGTGTADYFTVKFANDGQLVFTQISGTTNPPSNVPSTLKLTLRDCFGHNNIYSVDFTVLRRPNE